MSACRTPPDNSPMSRVSASLAMQRHAKTGLQIFPCTTVRNDQDAPNNYRLDQGRASMAGILFVLWTPENSIREQWNSSYLFVGYEQHDPGAKKKPFLGLSGLQGSGMFEKEEGKEERVRKKGCLHLSVVQSSTSPFVATLDSIRHSEETAFFPIVHKPRIPQTPKPRELLYLSTIPRPHMDLET